MILVYVLLGWFGISIITVIAYIIAVHRGWIGMVVR